MKTLSAIIAGILAGLMLSSSPTFANNANLPEPRYVQTGAKVEYVAGKRFEIPEIEDRWDDTRDEKEDALEKILGSSDDCDSVRVGATGVGCSDYGTECNGSWEETSCSNDKKSMFYDILCNPITHTKKECNGTTYRTLKTTFYVSYTEMYGISKSTSFFNDDDVCFDDDNGESYSIDTASSGAAAEAASLMKELRDINRAMNANGPSQSQIHQQRESALRAYQAAVAHEGKVKEVASCLERAYTMNGSKDSTALETLNAAAVEMFHNALNCVSKTEWPVRKDALDQVRRQSPGMMPYITKVESMATQ